MSPSLATAERRSQSSLRVLRVDPLLSRFFPKKVLEDTCLGETMLVLQCVEHCFPFLADAEVDLKLSLGRHGLSGRVRVVECSGRVVECISL